MKRSHPTRALRRTIVVTLALNAFALPTIAVSAMQPGRPLVQQQIRSLPPSDRGWRAVRTGSHVAYGTITSLHAALLTLRLRNGRLLVVDATVAVAHGDYSAPLFVGKTVSVDGELRGTHLVAAHVFRMDRLTNIAPDR